MRFKLDENFGSRTVSLFKQMDYDVQTVSEQKLNGSTDQKIYNICKAEKRCLVTLDLDFADVLRFPPQEASGIMVIRLPRNPSLSMLEYLVRKALNYNEKQSIKENLWIVEVDRIRVYQKPD
ncbi:hypothetical protein EH223_15645 [candidate division KSB1 bacterium]|nr:DUF5615 family PIN-like protein [candidate division KSB1 bacterium]RQW01348.1 MAG: hypothetical protein EH223_15645 [candidate division KSB1 bacterium]